MEDLKEEITLAEPLHHLLLKYIMSPSPKVDTVKATWETANFIL